MLLNKLFYFNSKIVIEERNKSQADLSHMPQLVHMRHIAMANQLQCPTTNCLGLSYDRPGYPSITVGAPSIWQQDHQLVQNQYTEFILI